MHLAPVARMSVVLIAALLVGGGAAAIRSAGSPLVPAVPQGRQAAIAAGPTGRALPIVFESNLGQADPAARYVARAGSSSLVLADDAVLIRLASDSDDASPATVRLTFPGGSLSRPEGNQPLPGVVNYYLGNDASRWLTDVPTWGRVRYGAVYPGIDVEFHAAEGALEYDLLVAPGADPTHARLSFEGIQGRSITSDGALVLATAAGIVRQPAPLIYQETSTGRRTVPGGFTLRDGLVGFWVGDYDLALPLVIDPRIEHSSYLGGNGTDRGRSIALDPSGIIIVTGITNSSGFPTGPNSGVGVSPNSQNGFLTRISADGSTILSSTLYGGTSLEDVLRLTLSGGNIWVTGETKSSNFPVTTGVTQPSSGGSSDAFVARFSSTGTLQMGTYLGGPLLDIAQSIAVDRNGNAWVTGYTHGLFPLLNPLQSTQQGLPEAFVTKISASGTRLYSTYLGGGASDFGFGITIASNGEPIVVGTTNSTNFPTKSPLQATNGGQNDIFVARLSALGDTLRFSTYLGGNGSDSGQDIALAGANIWITGIAGNSSFPRKAFGGTDTGGVAVAVAKLTGGGALLATGRFGGNANDVGLAIEADSVGNAWITGYTSSSDFPRLNPLSQSSEVPSSTGSSDLIVTGIDAAGARIFFSSDVGLAGTDQGNDLTVNTKGQVWLAGESTGSFPEVNPFQQGLEGVTDAVVLKITTFEVRAAVVGHGKITSSPGGISCGSDCVEPVAFGSSMRFTATPATGWRFVRWEGDCSGTATTCTLVVGKDHFVRAVFEFGLSGINDVATLDTAHGILTVSGHFACRFGATATLEITVTQAATGGTAGGTTSVNCRRDAVNWTLPIDHLAAGTFQPGPAHVCAAATVSQGRRVLETRQWCKDITIVANQ